MVVKTEGDLLQSSAHALVNPVNCRGVMGKGLARGFADTFPEILPAYRAVCRDGRLRPGRVQLLTRPDGRIVANAATKDDWRAPARLAWVDQALAELHTKLRARAVPTVAVPLLGAGNGGLDRATVIARVERVFAADPDMTIYLYTT